MDTPIEPPPDADGGRREIVVLGVALAAASASIVWILLSREGGYDMSLLRIHQRFAAAVVVGAFVTLVAWVYTARRLERGRARWAYRTALAATTLTLGAELTLEAASRTDRPSSPSTCQESWGETRAGT